MIDELEKQNMVDFFVACNDMIEGRFILSDTKVSNILKAVVKSETLYKLYGESMKGFRFNDALNLSLANNNGGHFAMPENDMDILAYVTCLLLEVDKKNINLQSFVTDNFYSAEGYNISYSNFALIVLSGYKEAVKSLLGIDEKGDFTGEVEEVEEEPVEEVKPDDNTKILFANLLFTINELQTAINEESKIKFSEKEELMIVLKGLNRAVHLQELILINALLIPLEYKIGKNKKLKNQYDKLKMLIADIYF